MRRHWLGARYWAAICAVVAVLGGMAFAAFAQDDGEGPEKVREKVRFLLKSPVLHGAKVGILAKSLATGEVLYRRDADQPLIPASTNKLVTGAAALDILGPKYKFKTEVYVDPPMGGDGGVAGNLYVKGYGDPSITVEEAWLLAHQIYGHGVRAVAGDLIGDDSFFEPVRFYESWGFKTPRSYSAPMGALSFNWNTLQAYVAPATAAGQPAHVTLNPEGDYYTLDNRVVTCEQCRTILSLALGTRSAVVSGKIGVGSEPMTTFASVPDPLPPALSSMKNLLEKEGVTFAGVPRPGTVPDTARLLFTHESRELSLIIRFLYRFSNNFTAEQIHKTLGAHAAGAPATREKGAQAIVDYLKKVGAYQAGLVNDDGSGLSRKNRISAQSLVDLLVHVANQPEIFPEYLDAMAIGAVDGTLSNRFHNTVLERRVRAKTGYLYGVITLAGYAWTTEGEPYAFAILINDPPPKSSVRDVRKKLDEILVALMTRSE